jgi:hypothetical protein
MNISLGKFRKMPFQREDDMKFTGIFSVFET